MDQFNVWKLIGRQWKIIVVLILVVFGASLAAYGAKPKGVVASLAVTVLATPVDRSAAGQLVLQDNATQDTQLAVSTTSSWLSDPSYVQEVVKEGIAVDDSSIRGLGKYFKVVTGTPGSATYDVQYSATDPVQAAKIASAVRTILQQGADNYNAQKLSPISIGTLIGTEIVTADTGSLPLTPIAGLLVGIIFALTVAALADRRRA